MAQIIQFPSCAAFPASLATAPAAAGADAECSTLPCTSGRRCEYAVGDLARMLGISHFAPRTVIEYLRVKARDAAMPLPKTPRVRDDALVQGVRAIWRQSRWDAELFDAWLAESTGHGPVPPVTNALRADLARRAMMIGAQGEHRSAGGAR